MTTAVPPVSPGRTVPRITVVEPCVGLAVVRGGDNAEALLARADGALYKSKQSGRNQLNICDEVEVLV